MPFINKDSLPYIILKYASTLNGIIGSNSNNRLILSNQQDILKVMEIRSEVDAILIGAGTLIKDNPQLTIRNQELINRRLEKGLSSQPTRVVIAKGIIEEKNLNLFTDHSADTYLFSRQIDHDLPFHVKQIQFNEDSNQIIEALKILKSIGIKSVLIEGGARIIEEVLKLRIADQIRILYAPSWRKTGTKIQIDEDLNLSTYEKKIEKLGNQFALNLTCPSRAR